MSETQGTDLAAVLAAVWPPARQAAKGATPERRRELIWELLTEDGKRPRAGLPLELEHPTPGKGICGKNVRLVRDAEFQVGGNGVVIPCEEAAVEGVRYALKVPRPSIFTAEQARALAEKAERELKQHLPLSHENVARMIGYDEISVDWPQHPNQISLPGSLVEWVEGAQPLHRYIETVKDPFELVDIIRQACRGLSHLHGFKRIHWDVKGDNILVSADGVVKLMDFGNLRDRVDGIYTKASEAHTTYLNLPEALQSRVTELLEDEPPAVVSLNNVPVVLRVGEQSWDQPWLDLYMLAREVNRAIGLDSGTLRLDEDVDRLRSPSDRVTRTQQEIGELRARLFTGDAGTFALRYLEEVVKRMLAAPDPDRRFYPEAVMVERALGRLSPEYGDATDVAELQAVPQRVLRIPPNDNVPWTSRIEAIMNSAPLLRLKGHRQLASVHHVFPGAVHTRWEHALGSFNELLQYVRALYADRASPLFRLDTTKRDITALMLASLIHDIGHPAFGHQLEECAVVPKPLRHEAYTRDVLDACLVLHTGRTVSGAAGRDATELRPLLEEHWESEGDLDALIQRVIEILEAAPLIEGEPLAETAVDEAKRIHTELLHSLIDGDMDVDRMDYLRRDAHHAGVEYANGIDKHRFEQALTSLAVPSQPTGMRLSGVLGVTRKGVLPLESLMIARYQMFRAVYWQHTVRAMTVMLQEAVELQVTDRDTIPVVVKERELLEVLKEFRRRNDEEAIAWLEKRLGEDHAHLCHGVRGFRHFIYWDIADLYGSENFKRGSSSDEFPLTSYANAAQSQALESAFAAPYAAAPDHAETDRQYGVLQEIWGSDDDTNPAERVDRRLQFRSCLVERLNELCEHPAFDLTDILLDVPMVGRDDIKNLYVAPGDGATRQAERLDAMTPLAKAVKDAFERSARTARVFVRPERARDGAILFGSDEEFAARVKRALASAVDEHTLRQDAAGDALIEAQHDS